MSECFQDCNFPVQIRITAGNPELPPYRFTFKLQLCDDCQYPCSLHSLTHLPVIHVYEEFARVLYSEIQINLLSRFFHKVICNC